MRRAAAVISVLLMFAFPRALGKSEAKKPEHKQHIKQHCSRKQQCVEQDVLFQPRQKHKLQVDSGPDRSHKDRGAQQQKSGGGPFVICAVALDALADAHFGF